MANPLPERLKSLFVDLGKPTLRGVRKCPKCGTSNGTRGLICKNKRCDVVFKDREKKKVQSAECVKIITGDSIQLYSVRLRDRGPDYRGFVQLPTIVDADGNITSDPVDPSILMKAARCYVEQCPGNSPSGGQECSHVRAAVTCNRNAEPLELTAPGIEAVRYLPEDVRHLMLALLSESSAPVVQRVTKNVMVVKCRVSFQHPLGFLHFTLPNAVRDHSELQRKVHCGCHASYSKMSKDVGINFRCSHFYACACAFASSNDLANEFQLFLKLISENQSESGEVMLLDLEDVLISYPTSSINNDHTLVDLDRHSHIMSSESLVQANEIEDSQAFELIVEGDMEEVELDDECANKRMKLTEDQLNQDFSVPVCSIAVKDQSDTSVTSVLQHMVDVPVPTSAEVAAAVVAASSTLLNRMQNGRALKTGVTEVNLPHRFSCSLTGESEVIITFEDWLSSVTERINQTMHYQFDGNPVALVFHIQQSFFDCLQQRMSIGIGGRKKRLPNTSVSFERRDALPLGNFVKYTWKLTNLQHVKQIFDTRQRLLEITRRFVENRDGTFSLCESPPEPDEIFAGKQLIRPFELKTFLKVGNLMAGQREPTPFVLEWIPDILPLSHIGELRISFQYGHQRNGTLEIRPTLCHSDTLTMQSS